MDINVRQYVHDQDYDRVGDFLIEQYRPGNNLLLWIQPRWEYMHYHTLIKETDISKIGVAEVDGAIVGVVHHEHDEGMIYFQVHPAYEITKRRYSIMRKRPLAARMVIAGGSGW